MSTCVVVDTSDWIGAGTVSVGDTGFGVLGSSVPSTGTHGPGYAYDALTLPADNNVEVCGRITVWPTRGTLVAAEDTSFVYTATSDGADSFAYQPYKNGIAFGSPQTETLQVGGADATTGGATLTSTGTLTGGAAAGISGGSAPGANLTGGGTLTGGAAAGTSSGSAPGATLASTGTLTGGSATGGTVIANGSAPGANLTGGGTIRGGGAVAVDFSLPVNLVMLYHMPGSGWNFPDLIAGDIATLSFDFKDELPPGISIMSATPHPVTHVGIDPNPAALVVAGPTISGSVVSIQVHAFNAGCSYWPRVTASFSDGQAVTYPIPGEGSLRVVA